MPLRKPGGGGKGVAGRRRSAEVGAGMLLSSAAPSGSTHAPLSASSTFSEPYSPDDLDTPVGEPPPPPGQTAFGLDDGREMDADEEDASVAEAEDPPRPLTSPAASRVAEGGVLEDPQPVTTAALSSSPVGAHIESPAAAAGEPPVAANEADWLQEHKRLRRHATVLRQRIMASAVVSKDPTLPQLAQDLDRKTVEESEELKRTLRRFKAELDDIRELLRAVSFGEENPDRVKSALEHFEDSMMVFKGKMRTAYDDLATEEHQLTSEIQNVALAAASWETSKEVRDRMARDKERENAERNKLELRMQQEHERHRRLGEIEKQITAAGGRSGGWDDRDQDSFLRIWTQVSAASASSAASRRQRNGNASSGSVRGDDDAEDDGSSVAVQSLSGGARSTLIRRVTVLVPGKDVQDVEQHVEWYEQYLGWQAEKRKLLEDWKVSRRKERDDASSAAASSGDATSVGDASTKSGLSRRLDPAERLRRRQQVKAWKEAKQKQEQEEREESQRRAQREAMEEQAARRRRARTMHQKVSMFQYQRDLEKQALEQAQALRDERARAAAPTQQELEKRRKRDLEVAQQRRVAWERRRERETHNRVEHVLKQAAESGTAPAPVAERDPSRLIAPTSASKHRAYTADELDTRETERRTAGAHESRGAMHGADLKYVGRAVPTWVQMGR